MATIAGALDVEMNVYKSEMDISQENIKAISTLMDTLGLDASSSKISNKSPAEQEKIMIKGIEKKYGFMLGDDGQSLFINGEPISESNPKFQEMLKELNAASVKFNSILSAAGNTSYPQQIKARLAVLGSTPNVGFRVTKP